MAPFDPQENARGLPPRPRTLAVCSSKSCAACGIRCGVHGFAMNPYYSLPLATAPYYRGARVTLARRQTACRMRHCCARRIEECSGRRRFGCTTTRLAERQRMIEAEESRIATLTRQRRAQAFPLRRHKGYSTLRLPIKSLSLGVSKGPFSFAKENGPFVSFPCAGETISSRVAGTYLLLLRTSQTSL